MTEVKIKCLYLETSTLRESEWPHVSTRLEQLFSVAKELGVQVVLPEPVDREREQQWLREFQKEADQQRSAWGTVQKRLANIGAVDLSSPSFPEEAELRRLYRSSVEAIKGQWSIVDAPYTSRSLRDLFKLATKHQPPFREEGRGFQDAVIFLSVVEHSAADADHKLAILVSSDGDFKAIDIGTIAPDLKETNLKISRLDEATAILKSHLGEAVQRRWDELQEKAKRKLLEIHSELESFLMNNIAAGDFSFLETVLEVYQIALVGIDNVQTPDPRELKPGEEFEISAELELKISGAVASLSTISYTWTKETFYIGGQRHLKDPEGRAASLRTIDVLVEIQARATLSDGEFDKITPISAKVGPSGKWGTMFINSNPGVLTLDANTLLAPTNVSTQFTFESKPRKG